MLKFPLVGNGTLYADPTWMVVAVVDVTDEVRFV